MIDFVGTSPFLRIALCVAIETMHLHIARLSFFLEDKKIMHSLCINEQFATHKELSWRWGSQVGHIRSRNNPHGQNWVGGVTPCTKCVLSSFLTEFYHCLCA